QARRFLSVQAGTSEQLIVTSSIPGSIFRLELLWLRDYLLRAMSSKESVKQSHVILLIENDESDVFFFRRALSSCQFRGVVRVVGTAWQARDYMEGRGEFRDRSYYPLPNLI